MAQEYVAQPDVQPFGQVQMQILFNQGCGPLG
jgi:hypothetical protein